MKKKPPFDFHPHELSFCGSSGAGKTTLLCSVVEHLQGKLDIGVVKHCGKGYDLAPEHKDSTRLLDANASFVMVHDDKKAALLSNAAFSTSQTLALMLSKDAVLVEGHKFSRLPKIAVFGEGRKGDDLADSILADIDKSDDDGDNGKVENIVAVVSQNPSDVIERVEQKLGDVPVFHRDDVESIAAFVFNFLRVKAARVPVYGLLLTGGRSSRMGEDKALLKYGEEAQVTRAMKLLEDVCDKSFVSRRFDQVDDERSQFPAVVDAFIDMGPLGGILSALQAHPEAAWLVLAIDLPFVSQKVLDDLVSKRNPLALATGYRNVERGFVEPLITLYEPKARQVLLMEMAAGKRCPRRALGEHHVEIIERSSDQALDNINTQDEREEALRMLSVK
ncbi:MAG: NTP transferase domain-containing protein [Deltaproteobacteria bacterium]|nr:NTP transferase domain-containing protein [Deltaproteobacteria bacterium]